MEQVVNIGSSLQTQETANNLVREPSGLSPLPPSKVPYRHFSKLKSGELPTLEDIERLLARFERLRVKFNSLQAEYQIDNERSKSWDRMDALRHLADELAIMSAYVFENMALTSNISAYNLSTSSLASSLLGFASWWNSSATETDGTGVPEDQYELCYDTHGLKVWKKDFGNNRIIVRGEFTVPVSPQQYSSYASDVTKRHEWDPNVLEARIIEKIDDTVDICYVALKRIAAIYPRDYLNIRVIRPVQFMSKAINNNKDENNNPRIIDNAKNSKNTTWRHDEYVDTNTCAVYSCSCSVEHPDIHELVGCYLAQPLKLPLASTPWSRIYMFSEVDPGGWLPTALSKHLAAKVLPGSVDRIVSCVLDRYNIPWRATPIFDTTTQEQKIAESALEYCDSQYSSLVTATKGS